MWYSICAIHLFRDCAAWQCLCGNNFFSRLILFKCNSQRKLNAYLYISTCTVYVDEEAVGS